MIRKQVLDRIEAGYALLVGRASYGDFLFVGSEKKDGESRVIRLDTREVSLATAEVGGMMQIVPIPSDSGAEQAGYLAAMGMYAPFIGRDAAVYHLRPATEWGEPWTVEKLFDLPFAHRLGFAQLGRRVYLFVGVVSDDKNDPDDWTQPGRLYVTDLFKGLTRGEWELHSIGHGLFRHHGMWTGTLDGQRKLLVSAAEGLFAVRAVSTSGDDDATAALPGHGFGLEGIIRQEISEMVVSDIDGDGIDEIVAIEPFHGHRLRVYKRHNGNQGCPTHDNWRPVWERDDLSFAHGLNVVPTGERKLIVVGNRRDGCELLGFDPGNLRGDVRRIVLDEGVGPTQIEPWFGAVSNHRVAERVALISCNQAAGEVAMYDVSDIVGA